MGAPRSRSAARRRGAPRGRPSAGPRRTTLLAGSLIAGLGGLACRPPGPPDPSLGAVAPTPARFAPGDELEIRVWAEDSISGKFQIQDDGTIDLPPVGAIELAGATQPEAARRIEAALADGWVRDPVVTVVVVARQNREISVLGAVQRPGSFGFVEDLTLVQALSLAGGLTQTAAPRRIRITRRGSEGPTTFEVSLRAITEGRAPDLKLVPGDIVFVPESAL